MPCKWSISSRQRSRVRFHALRSHPIDECLGVRAIAWFDHRDAESDLAVADISEFAMKLLFAALAGSALWPLPWLVDPASALPLTKPDAGTATVARRTRGLSRSGPRSRVGRSRSRSTVGLWASGLLVGGVAGDAQRACGCGGGALLLAGLFGGPRVAARVERLGCGDVPAVAVGGDGSGGQQPRGAQPGVGRRCAERSEPSGAGADGVVEHGGGAVLDRVLAFFEGLGEVAGR